jgi:hypothetical protein
MAGSGTTPATAQRLRHKAIAFDSDPLAVKIARAWCSQVDEIDFLQEAILVLQAAQDCEREFGTKGKDIFPDDDETGTFAEFWFDATTRRQLAALSAEIRAIRSEPIRSMLWCVFSRMIVTKESGVSLAMDVSHSRPHKVYVHAPITPFALWPRTVSAVAQTKFVCNHSQNKLPRAKICQGDARKLPLMAESVDIVITSPPYLNAIDYLRGHRLSLIWMGYSISDLRRRRSKSIGTEAGADFDDDDPRFERARDAFRSINNSDSLANRERRMIRRYIVDLDGAIGEVARVLRPAGRAIYVVGDCNLRGQFIENSRIVCSLMQSHHLDWISTRRRRLPGNKRYLPPPCSKKSGTQLQARMGDEVILAFRKP